MTGGDEDGTTAPPTQHATREQLRALAHPLRLEIMDRISRRGTARAADVAADLDMPANSVSYHLRILARGDVIEEAPEAARDRRDRVWRLARTAFSDVGSGAVNDPRDPDPEYRAASGAMSLAAIDWLRSAWSAEIARSSARDAAPEEGLGTMVATTLRLSRAQVKELDARVSELITEYGRRNRDEDLALLPGDPDSGGEALSFRVLWAVVGEQSPERDAHGTAAREDADGGS